MGSVDFSARTCHTDEWCMVYSIFPGRPCLSLLNFAVAAAGSLRRRRSQPRTQRSGRPGVPHLHPRSMTPHGEGLCGSPYKEITNMTLRARQAPWRTTSLTKRCELPFGPCWLGRSCAPKNRISPALSPAFRTSLNMAKGMPSNWARLGTIQCIFSPIKAAREKGHVAL
jgi:hypothetical protein